MYRTVKIQNFRLFHELILTGLSDINLFVGRNGAGKTSLLEAILLLSGMPFQKAVAGLRGQRGEYWDSTQNTLRELISLFQNPVDKIDIRATGDNVEHSLEISGYSVDETKNDLLPTRFDEKIIEGNFVFAYGARGCYSITIVRDDCCVVTAERLPLCNASLRSTFSPPMGFCEAQKEHRDLINRLRQASEDAPYAIDIGVRMTQSPRGILVVDGIEKDLHWSILEPTWREIGNIARQLGVQIFATTYSYECIKAAYKALGGEVFLCRLDKYDDWVDAVVYDREALEIALTENLEVR